ncbi:MAG: hypothetical protein ACYSWQ_21985 [Planctomycetota bacterium]
MCSSDVQEPKRSQYKNDHVTGYVCKRCGDFKVFDGPRRFLPNLLKGEVKKASVLSHWIRTKHEEIKKSPPDEQFCPDVIIVDTKLVDAIMKRPPPSPAEQADNLIRWLGESGQSYGEYLSLEAANDLSIIGSATGQEFMWVSRHLSDSGLIKGSFTTTGVNVMLSFEGWQYYEQLKSGDTAGQKAFMAMEYGNVELDKIVDEVLRPAVKQTGFDLFKLVDRPRAGSIDDRLRIEIQTSRFLIADLTHENAGAYWEAGYAEGLGKQVIYTCEKEKFEEQKTHFDTNHHLTVVWDADNPHEAAEALKATIRATLPSEAKLTDE